MFLTDVEGAAVGIKRTILRTTPHACSDLGCQSSEAACLQAIQQWPIQHVAEHEAIVFAEQEFPGKDREVAVHGHRQIAKRDQRDRNDLCPAVGASSCPVVIEFTYVRRAVRREGFPERPDEDRVKALYIAVRFKLALMGVIGFLDLEAQGSRIRLNGRTG